MSDFDELAIATATALHDISAHAKRLGVGLQNAAPAAAQSNHSIQYLQAIADVLETSSKECSRLGPAHLQE